MNKNIEEYIDFFLVVIEFPSLQPEYLYNEQTYKNIDFTPIDQIDEDTFKQENEIDEELKTVLNNFSENLIRELNKEDNFFCFENESEKICFKELFLEGYKYYTCHPQKLLAEEYDSDLGHKINKLQKNKQYFYENLHAFLLMAELSQFTKPYKELMDNQTLKSFDHNNYLLPAVLFRIQQCLLVTDSRKLKLSEACKFFERSEHWYTCTDMPKGFNLQLYLALEEIPIKENNNLKFRKSLKKIREVYHGNITKKLDEKIFPLIRSIDKFLKENKENKFFTSFYGFSFLDEAIKFSIYFEPTKNERDLLSFEQWTTHLQTNIKTQSCNPLYVYKWYQAFNQSDFQQKTYLKIKNAYWIDYAYRHNTHFYTSLLVAILSIISYLALVYTLISPMILIDFILTLGFASVLYAQFIININIFKNDDYISKKLNNEFDRLSEKTNEQQTNFFPYYNACILMNIVIILTLVTIALISYFVGFTSTLITPLIFTTMGVSSLFAEQYNKYISNVIIEKKSLAGTTIEINKHISNLGLNSIFNFNENRSKVEIKSLYKQSL